MLQGDRRHVQGPFLSTTSKASVAVPGSSFGRWDVSEFCGDSTGSDFEAEVLKCAAPVRVDSAVWLCALMPRGNLLCGGAAQLTSLSGWACAGR